MATASERQIAFLQDRPAAAPQAVPEPHADGHPPAPTPFARAAVAAMKEGPRGTVLQLPIGDGQLITYFARALEFVTGIDNRMSAIESAHRELEQCGLWNCNLLTAEHLDSLPLPDGQYAGVLCPDFLGHLDSPESAIREMLRVLRPGGHMVLEFFAPGDSTRHAPRAKGLGGARGPCRDEIFRYPDRLSLEDILTTAGVPEPWEIERVAWGPDPKRNPRSVLLQRESWVVTARKRLTR